MLGWYSNNILEVIGNKDELMKFHNSFKKDETPNSKSISFEKLYPVPVELFENIQDRYEWCQENWNLGYDDELECEKIIIEDKSISYHFITEYPPLYWINYVCKQLPNLTFNIEFDGLLKDCRNEDIYVRCSMVYKG